MNQIAPHNEASNKGAKESAELAKKIATKRTKRNDAYLRLQKEEKREQKKQDNELKNMQRAYEIQIEELSSRVALSVAEI